jgi:hypothetical protein
VSFAVAAHGNSAKTKITASHRPANMGMCPVFIPNLRYPTGSVRVGQAAVATLAAPFLHTPKIGQQFDPIQFVHGFGVIGDALLQDTHAAADFQNCIEVLFYQQHGHTFFTVDTNSLSNK